MLTEAYTELLQWDEYYSLPETLVMDQRRVFQIRDKVQKWVMEIYYFILLGWV